MDGKIQIKLIEFENKKTIKTRNYIKYPSWCKIKIR